jgi:KaiC/GvpD/RAD55 family RecA-like ATPase
VKQTLRQLPYAQKMAEVFKEALRELKTPYPSVKLLDWSAFNEVTGGFRPREFTILCGATGSGKTTFLANLSAQLLKARVKHFVMSVETGHTDFMKRIMSVLHGRDVNTGEAVDVAILGQITAQYHDLFLSDLIEFSLYDNRVSVQQLCSDLEYMAKAGCKVAFVDNLNFFLEVTSAANQVIEMDRVIHEVIMLCKRIDMHVIMVMHPKKTEHGRVESEFDIKGSSTAVQEAHNVFLFNRPKAEDLAGHGLNAPERTMFDRELKIAKMRRRGGYVGSALWFKSQGTRYFEVGIK